jgi:hypothetical protein
MWLGEDSDSRPTEEVFCRAADDRGGHALRVLARMQVDVHAERDAQLRRRLNEHDVGPRRMGMRPVESLDAHRSGAGSDVPHQPALARVKSVNRQASDLSRRELAELTAEELMIGCHDVTGL